MVWSTPSGEVLIDIVTRPGQTDHGHGGGALAYGVGGKAAGAVVAPPQPRPPAAPYAQQYPQLRLHQPGYGSAALTFRDGSYVRSGGAVGEYRAGGAGGAARLSLLGSYPPPPAPPAHHPPPADPPPYKKLRLTAQHHHDRHNHHQQQQHHAAPHAPHTPHTPLPHHQQLRVDTREPVNAYNVVEVLSPNPPSEPTAEDQNFRTTKDELLQQISKVDREMALSETSLSKLKKKAEELEQSASKPARAVEPEEAPPRHRSLAQCVYADNRKKATSAHALMSHLGPPVSYPLYNQPQDTEVYHENIRRNRTFRKRLAEHIRRIGLETEKREATFAEAYSRRAAEWLRRVERLEQGQKRKVKDAKNREFFEKVFPELRKAREERERFNRLGARVKSEAELEEIADGLHEQEHEDKKMRSLTVVPPLLRDPRDPRPVYIDTNRRCMDMESEHKDLQLRNVWSRPEREMFREKYLQHPKNFGQISSFLPRKSVRDCVRFYYLSKKAENYKQLLRKPRQRRPPRGPRPAPEPELPAGVTTRLQRSQGTTSRVTDKEANLDDASSSGSGVSSEALACIPVPPTGAPHHPGLELMRTPPLPPSPPPASSAPPAPATSTLSGSMPPLPPSSGTMPPLLPSSGIMSPLPPLPPGSPTPPVPAPTPPTSQPEQVVTTVAVLPAEVSTTPTVIITSSSSTTVVSSCPSVVSCCAPAVSACPPAAAPAAAPARVPAAGAGAAGSGGGAGAGGGAPAAPHPTPPPMPTHPPPTPEAAVTERIGTPVSTATTSASITRVPTPPAHSPAPALATVTVPSPAPAATCAVCGAQGATRTVSRSRAAHYGLKEDAVGARVCEPCHCRCVRSRYTRCPVPTCPGPRVRAKRLRHLPPRWHDLPLDVKRPLMDEFQIPSELSKCCLACFKRITRRLESVGEGGASTEPTEEEAARFRALVREHGAAWERMAAASGRAPQALKAFYFTYRKRLQLDALVAERPPPRAGSDTDESILSSGDTDTASAESPRPPPLPGPRTDAVAPKGRRRDEYDSSATETADEENDAPSAKIMPSITLSTAVPSSAPATPPGCAPPAPAPAAARAPAPPLTVRDVVLNMIEISLMKNSQPVPPAAKLHPPKVTTSSAARESLATLSVVSSSHVSSSPLSPSPHRPATITPLAQPQSDPMKDGVVVLIEPRAEPRQEPLLDLSVKRPRVEAQRQVLMGKPYYRNSERMEYSTQEYRQPERESPNQYNSKPKTIAQPPRPTLKPMPNPKGSITLGTPVENRYDARRTPPDPKAGSITAGTPVHGSHHMQEKKNFDYYNKRRSPGGPAYYAGVTSQPRPQSPSFSPNANAYTRPYGLDNRQIIMTDFITSQQMHGAARRVERAEGPARAPERPERPERAPSPQYAPAPPRRDQPVSVIQRHTPHVYPHSHPHPHPPPGHEAFTSLVDVASAATALPVPRGQPEPKPEPKQQSQHPTHPTHPTHHDIRLQDRLQRDMAIAQKYHQQQMQQYQVLERDNRVRQAQYMERDRQIAIQQNRERERCAMVAMQERQMAMEQHQHHQQQQMLHERHLQHQQIVSSQEERRLVSGPVYSTAAKHRSMTPLHAERKDIRPVVSSGAAPPSAPAPAPAGGGPGAAPPGAQPAEARARPTEGTLTAASLIDAIITHQISQTSDQRFPTLLREDNGASQPAGERVDRGALSAAEREREREEAAAAAAHTTSMKLGDLASNIITRDFCSPTTSILHHNNQRFTVASSEGYAVPAGAGAGGGGAGGEEWKRRDAPKHAPYLEPVSPPDNHHSNRNNSNRRYSGVGVGGVGGGGGVLTAFDYVTNRIVEVMRSDADERAKPPQTLGFPTAAYAYPYSALNVATPTPDGSAPASSAPPAPSAPAPPPPPEPAPLMSAQYEPLSDED